MSSVIGALRVNLGIDSAQFQNGLKNAQSGLQKFGSMAKKGLAAVGVAAAAAAGGMAMAVKGTINAADEMSKAAQKIGIPIEELSRLKYAADLSGVSFGGLQTSVGRLSRNMSDAAQGIGEGARAFEALGINVKNSDGSLKASSDVMREIADRFATMPDGAEKTALAMQLMGRSGADMIPMLNGGSEALGKLMSEADQFGQVFTQEMGSQAEAFNDNISRLQGAFGNLAAKLATALLPHLEKFTNWLIENAPAITAFVVKIVDFAANVIHLGATVASFVAGAWAQFVAAWDGLIAKVNAVDSRVKQFSSDIAGAFADLPAQMYQIGVDVMTGLWNGMKSIFGSIKEGVANLAHDYIVGPLKSALDIFSPSRVMHGIGVNIMEGLGNGIDSMTGSIKGGVTSVADSIAGAFEGVGSGIAAAIQGTKSWKDVALDAISSIARSLLQNMNFGGGIFGSIFKGLLGGLFGGFRANGGAVSAGRAYVVGERGPELMVPNSSGSVVPNHELGGGKTVIVKQSFTFSGAATSEELKAYARQMGAQAVDTAKRSMQGWNVQIAQDGTLA